MHEVTPLLSSPVWKNFPEYPKLKVKFGMWVRSSFCVSNSACERERESKISSVSSSRGQLHNQASSKARIKAKTHASKLSGEETPIRRML